MVPGDELGHGRPDRLDDPRALVPEHGRQRQAHRAAGDRDVGVADADPAHRDEDLVLARVVELDVLERQRLPDRAQDRRPRRDAHQAGLEVARSPSIPRAMTRRWISLVPS